MNLQEFTDYQKLELELADKIETAKYLRSEARRPFPARARNNSYETKVWKDKIAHARQLLIPVERELSALKSQVYKLRKVASLGVGEWVKEDVPATKHLAGSSRVYNHPEFGSVRHYSFGGWSMQRVAASATVEWTSPEGKTFRREWSGGTARDAARSYLKSVYGI